MNRRINTTKIQPSRKQTIGLLGGSFNPAHDGHLHIASYAKKKLGLKQVWFLPTLSNPLKNNSTDFTTRANSIQTLLQNKSRAYQVCMAEAGRSHEYSWQSIKFLRRRYRNAHFIWLMGADCWDELLLWQRWQYIFSLPLVVFSRHPIPLRSVRNRVGIVMSRSRIDSSRGRVLRSRKRGWVYYPMARHFSSSSSLRGFGG